MEKVGRRIIDAEEIVPDETPVADGECCFRRLNIVLCLPKDLVILNADACIVVFSELHVAWELIAAVEEDEEGHFVDKVMLG